MIFLSLVNMQILLCLILVHIDKEDPGDASKVSPIQAMLIFC